MVNIYPRLSSIYTNFDSDHRIRPHSPARMHTAQCTPLHHRRLRGEKSARIEPHGDTGVITGNSSARHKRQRGDCRKSSSGRCHRGRYIFNRCGISFDPVSCKNAKPSYVASRASVVSDNLGTEIQINPQGIDKTLVPFYRNNRKRKQWEFWCKGSSLGLRYTQLSCNNRKECIALWYRSCIT